VVSAQQLLLVFIRPNLPPHSILSPSMVKKQVKKVEKIKIKKTGLKTLSRKKNLSKQKILYEKNCKEIPLKNCYSV